MSLGNAAGAGRSFSPSGAPGLSGGGARINPAVVQLIMLIAIPFCLSSQDGNRYLIALVSVGTLSGLLGFAPSAGLCALFFYLCLESGLRRWLLPVFGYSANDPFLLVAPLVIGLNFANLLIGRQLPRNTTISRLVLWFLAIMTLQIFNPLQGGLVVGLAGALFYIVPVLWFYIGRLFASDTAYAKLMGFSLAIITLIAIYGQYQTFVGLLPVELDFLNYSGFTQRVSGVARVFSTLASPSEYATLLGIGAVFCVARVVMRRFQYALLALAFGAALFITSIRGNFVAMLITCGIVVAVQGRSIKGWLPRLGVTLLLGAAGLYWSLQKVQSGLSANDSRSTSVLVQHQLDGLLDPTHSTAGAHSSLQFYGVLSGFLHPFGLGLGSTTLAALKYGSTVAGTEGDIGNMFTSLGVAGGIVFILLVYHVGREAILHWHRARTMTALLALSLLALTFNYWLAGGNYAVVMLIWVTIGYIDRVSLQHKLSQQEDALPLRLGFDETRARLRRQNRTVSAVSAADKAADSV